MCLSSLNEKLTEKYRKEKAVIVAYKVVEIKKNGTAIPLYKGRSSVKFVKGVNVSRAKKIWSSYDGKYTTGFHMFKSLRDAQYCKWLGGSTRMVIKVYIKPKDILHVGTQGVQYSGAVIVASKIAIKSLKPV